MQEQLANRSLRQRLFVVQKEAAVMLLCSPVACFVSTGYPKGMAIES